MIKNRDNPKIVHLSVEGYGDQLMRVGYLHSVRASPLWSVGVAAHKIGTSFIACTLYNCNKQLRIVSRNSSCFTRRHMKQSVNNTFFSLFFATSHPLSYLFLGNSIKDWEDCTVISDNPVSESKWNGNILVVYTAAWLKTYRFRMNFLNIV